MARLMEGKAGLVTGAAGGIGRGVALELAREGATVVVSDLESAGTGGEETVRLIKQVGGEADFVASDVTSAADCEALVGRVVDAYGRLDFAVNNAGVAVHKRLAEVTEEEYDRVRASTSGACSDKAAFITGIALPIDGGYLTYSYSTPEADPAEGT